jgi:hypothetical protein
MANAVSTASVLTGKARKLHHWQSSWLVRVELAPRAGSRGVQSVVPAAFCELQKDEGRAHGVSGRQGAGNATRNQSVVCWVQSFHELS